jgi:hypothetical protein
VWVNLSLAALDVRLTHRRSFDGAWSDRRRASERDQTRPDAGAVAALTPGMRNTMPLLLVLVAAGCHAAPCGGCADWETCDVATNTCALNAGTRFNLVADDGRVPGDSWDPFFGPPDPYVCVSVGGLEQCTTVQSDDSSPTWNQELFADLDGDALETMTMGVRYEDSDLDSDDSICSGSITVTSEEVHAGGFRFNCNNGSYANFTLRNTARGTPTVAR